MATGTAVGSIREAELTERRLSSLLRVADAHRTGMALGDIPDLLPRGGPATEREVAEWLQRHPSSGAVVGGRAFGPSSGEGAGDLESRRQRGIQYWEFARELRDGPLSGVRSMLRSVAVTGSAAYGEPEPGDDLDFLVVTRTGSIWVFLAYTYAALRFRALPTRAAESPEPCFNFVLDDAEARTEYANARSFLFAREALMAKPVYGDDYYQGLLKSSSWMREQLPRLFGRWEGEGLPDLQQDRPAPLGVRVLNAVLYPWLAAYLQLRGLRLNRQYRRDGHPERAFRTVTRYRRQTFESERFERLTETYRPADVYGSGP